MIRKLELVKKNGCATSCLLDHNNYFNEQNKLIKIDWSKKVLDADQKTIQKINLIGNLEPDGFTLMFFHYLRSKNKLF